MLVNYFTRNILATKLMHISCATDSVLFTLRQFPFVITASNNFRICCLQSLMVQLYEQRCIQHSRSATNNVIARRPVIRCGWPSRMEETTTTASSRSFCCCF